MVLDLPDMVDAEPVGELDLIERLLIEPQLRILGPGLRQLMLVEKSEFHRGAPLLVRTLTRLAALGALARTAGKGGPARKGWWVRPLQFIQRRIAAATSSGLSSSTR